MYIDNQASQPGNLASLTNQSAQCCHSAKIAQWSYSVISGARSRVLSISECINVMWRENISILRPHFKVKIVITFQMYMSSGLFMGYTSSAWKAINISLKWFLLQKAILWREVREIYTSIEARIRHKKCWIFKHSENDSVEMCASNHVVGAMLHNSYWLC